MIVARMPLKESGSLQQPLPNPNPFGINLVQTSFSDHQVVSPSVAQRTFATPLAFNPKVWTTPLVLIAEASLI